MQPQKSANVLGQTSERGGISPNPAFFISLFGMWIIIVFQVELTEEDIWDIIFQMALDVLKKRPHTEQYGGTICHNWKPTISVNILVTKYALIYTMK